MNRVLKFYYRDLKMHGIHYQKWPKKSIFLRKYIALDGTEREKWVCHDPDCAYNAYLKMIDRVLVRRKPSDVRGILRRATFKLWLVAMNSPRWVHYKHEFKLGILKNMMFLLEKYVISGRIPLRLRAHGVRELTAWLLNTAFNKECKEFKVDSLPLD